MNFRPLSDMLNVPSKIAESQRISLYCSNITSCLFLNDAIPVRWYVTGSCCADVCGGVDWRCSSSGPGTGVGDDVQPKEDGDAPPRVRDAASANHAAAWIPTRVHAANDGEVVGDE